MIGKKLISGMTLLLALSCCLLLGSAVAPEQSRLFVFEGSDWCNNCLRLEDNILRDSRFSSFLSQEQIVLERIDFPQRKKLPKQKKDYNRSVAEQLGFSGVFPTLILTDRSMTKKIEVTYNNQNTEEFICLLEKKMEELH